MQLMQEFNRQVHNLVQKDYHELLQMTELEFIEKLEPLKGTLENLEIDTQEREGYLSFVIVIKTGPITAEQMLSRIDFKGKPGFENMFPTKPEDYHPIPSVTIPNSWAYLMVNIDRGAETLNITPSEALTTIQAHHRSPLTIDEGLAILTHHPEFLAKNNCFSLLASRAADLRVPALWISDNKPKLGWCWNGNPHTWLGSASCAERQGLGVT